MTIKKIDTMLKTQGKKVLFRRYILVAFAAVIVVVSVIAVQNHFGARNANSLPDLSSGSQPKVYKEWEYVEFDTYVVLTNINVPEETAVKVTVPDAIDDKPVADIADDCFKNLISLYGNNWEAISWNVSEYNEYLTYEETLPGPEDEYPYYSCALYNKSKTTLYFVYYCGAGAPEGINRFEIPNTVNRISYGALCMIDSPIVFKYDKAFFTVENNMLFDKEKTRLIRVLDIHASQFSYEVPDSVVTLDPGAFCGVTCLNQDYMEPAYLEGDPYITQHGLGFMDIIVSLPDHITEIPDYTFSSSYAGLKKTPENLEYIGRGAFHSGFYGKLNKTLFISKSVKEIGRQAFSPDGTLLKLDPDNPYFVIENNVLFARDKTEFVYLIQNPDPGITSCIIPDTVNIIWSGAITIGDTDSITEFTVPASVVQIEEMGIELYRWQKPITIYGESGSCIEQYINNYKALNEMRGWNSLIEFVPTDSEDDSSLVSVPYSFSFGDVQAEVGCDEDFNIYVNFSPDNKDRRIPIKDSFKAECEWLGLLSGSQSQSQRQAGNVLRMSVVLDSATGKELYILHFFFAGAPWSVNELYLLDDERNLLCQKLTSTEGAFQVAATIEKNQEDGFRISLTEYGSEKQFKFSDLEFGEGWLRGQCGDDDWNAFTKNVLLYTSAIDAVINTDTGIATRRIVYTDDGEGFTSDSWVPAFHIETTYEIRNGAFKPVRYEITKP